MSSLDITSSEVVSQIFQQLLEKITRLEDRMCNLESELELLAAEKERAV